MRLTGNMNKQYFYDFSEQYLSPYRIAITKSKMEKNIFCYLNSIAFSYNRNTYYHARQTPTPYGLIAVFAYKNKSQVDKCVYLMLKDMDRVIQ